MRRTHTAQHDLRQDTVIGTRWLSVGEAERPAESNGEAVNTPFHLWSSDIPTGVPHQINGERAVFATNCAGKTG